MKLSVVYLTYRPGGIGMFLRSLAGTPAGDYELLVVDDYPGRPQRDNVRNHCKDLGVPLAFHGPSKPRRADTYQGLLNAMNTACLLASGSHVLFCHDFMVLPYGALGAWKKALSEPGDFLLHGAAEVVSVGADRPPNVTDDLKSWSFEPHLKFVKKWEWVPQPATFEMFYFACPLAYVERINGFDERGDHCGVMILDSVTSQARLNGYELRVDPGLRCTMVDHRVWGDGGLKWKIPAETTSSEKTWGWEARSPNDFDMKETRNGKRPSS